MDYDMEVWCPITTFKGGTVYQYGGVPEPIYRELVRATSKGRYFAEHIRDGLPGQRVA